MCIPAMTSLPVRPPPLTPLPDPKRALTSRQRGFWRDSPAFRVIADAICCVGRYVSVGVCTVWRICLERLLLRCPSKGVTALLL